MGLHFDLGEYIQEIGTVSGSYRDHQVLVRPDKPAIIVDFRERAHGLDLSTFWDGRRGKDVILDSGHRAFDRLFKKRHVSSVVAEKLKRHPEIFEQTVQFHRRWRWLVAQIDVWETNLSTWWRGSISPYISASEMEASLPDMLDLIEAYERAIITE